MLILRVHLPLLEVLFPSLKPTLIPTNMRHIRYSLFLALAAVLLACGEDSEAPMVTADFSTDATVVTAGDEVSFTDQSTGSPTSWTWNFPGGTPSTSQEQNPTVTYLRPGTYDVTLIAANSNNEDTETKVDYITVEVALPPVVANFTLSSDTIEIGNSITFTSTSTGNPTALNWAFEEGTPSTSSEQEQEVTFGALGTHDITLSVSNGSRSDDTTQTVTVVPKCSLSTSSFDCAETLVFDQMTEGAINERGKQNYYIFTLPRAAVVEVVTTNIDPAVNLQAAFYHEDRSEIEKGSPVYNTSRGGELKYDILLDSGTYYLRLDDRSSDGNGNQPYQLTVSLDSSDVNEFNNNIDSATPITFTDNSSGVINGTIRAISDADYFAFTLEEPAVVEILITNIDPAIRMEIQLYNEDGTTNGREVSASFGENQLIYNRLLRAGTYYLRLNDQSNDDSGETPYNLTVSLDASDANEINNSIDEATPITFTDNSSGVISGTIRSVGDTDYFMFMLDEPAVVEFLITNIDPAIRMEIQLYNEDRTTNGGDVQAPFGQNQLTHNRLLSAGTYYLRLNDQYNDNSGRSIYELTVSLDKSDPNELNESIEDATTINLGTTVKGTIRSVGDQDFYQFTLNRDAVVNVSVSNIDPAIRMEMQLFNEDKTTNGESVFPPFGQSQINHDRQLGAGTYFLRLNDQFNDQSGEAVYELTVTANSSQ